MYVVGLETGFWLVWGEGVMVVCTGSLVGRSSLGLLGEFGVGVGVGAGFGGAGTGLAGNGVTVHSLYLRSSATSFLWSGHF